jgi:hypothetical protein
MISRTWLKVSPVGSRRFSQSGLRPAGGFVFAAAIALIPNLDKPGPNIWKILMRD